MEEIMNLAFRVRVRDRVTYGRDKGLNEERC
jgi:hypothetical protein